MNRPATEENSEIKNSSYVKQETASYGYDVSYVNYPTTTTTATTLNQPLPGQPPLPPMPPPQGAVPPPPSVFGPVPTQVSQVSQMHGWPHTAATWQWITPQATPLPLQSPRDIAAAFQKEGIPLRNNYMKRERFNQNRNSVYQHQRGNFHRKNRRVQRYEQQSQNQFDQMSYFGAAMTHNLGLEWQRGNEALMSQMQQLPVQNQIPPLVANVNSRRPEDSNDQDIKEELITKKAKQRKPMSQSYPTRPWNREDAEKALKVENEFSKTVKSQSLIIKFPDPDLNKDIVREFHSGIRNIHFQSPSGARYCFIQMAENVNIDEAIKELEQISFGVGHLKVERKSSRDDDNPTPEEIDPYTLYIGNLPESVNVNEVKNKFPTAARVDVGFAQKMRNTRYAFIRYNNVDESIAAYEQAHDSMWDTRSIIVRFRRQRGNTSLPGEPKSNPKKNKETAKIPNSDNDNLKGNDQQVTTSSEEQENNHITSYLNNERLQPELSNDPIENTTSTNKANNTESSIAVSSSVTPLDSDKDIQQISQPTRISSVPFETGESMKESETLITEIKEEPVDYDEINEMSVEYDDDDDDDDGDIYNHNEEEDDEDSDYDDDIINRKSLDSKPFKEQTAKEEIPSDHLDKMFSDLENTAGDIDL